MDACALALVLLLTARTTTLIPTRMFLAALPGVQLAASGHDVVSHTCSIGALSLARDLLHHFHMGATAEARGRNLTRDLGFPADGRFLALSYLVTTYSLLSSTDGIDILLGFHMATLPQPRQGTSQWLRTQASRASSLLYDADSPWFAAYVKNFHYIIYTKLLYSYIT
jgi:hypothetical protein